MNAREILRNNNIKVTKCRVGVLEILFDKTESISVEQINKELISNGYEVDLSTVYRTLDTFFENNIVNKFDLGEGRYNYSYDDNYHRHRLACEVCQSEVEIDCPMVAIEELIKKSTGYTLVDHSLDFKVICKKCNKQKK